MKKAAETSHVDIEYSCHAMTATAIYIDTTRSLSLSLSLYRLLQLQYQ